MMRKNFIASAIMIILGGGLLVNVAHAGGRLTNRGTTSASFLEVGIGARSMGMGGAYVAVAQDAIAMYWNPAGLSRIQQASGTFEQVDWVTDVSFNFLAATIPLGTNIGSMGVFINSMSMPNQPVRTVQYPDGNGEEYSASSLVAGLSYGRNLTDRFSMGLNAKYISERIWHEKASSFAFDIGTLYDTGIEGLRIGACISNFGPGLKLDGSDLLIYYDVDPQHLGNNDKIMAEYRMDEWPLPLNMQFGLSYTKNISSGAVLLVALDALHPINATESLNLGTELTLFNMIYMRAGYNALFLEDSEAGMTLGGGLNYRLFGASNIRIDYAYADLGRLGEISRFTLGLNF
jgi:hypothetical protein